LLLSDTVLSLIFPSGPRPSRLSILSHSVYTLHTYLVLSALFGRKTVTYPDTPLRICFTAPNLDSPSFSFDMHLCIWTICYAPGLLYCISAPRTGMIGILFPSLPFVCSCLLRRASYPHCFFWFTPYLPHLLFFSPLPLCALILWFFEVDNFILVWCERDTKFDCVDDSPQDKTVFAGCPRVCMVDGMDMLKMFLLQPPLAFLSLH
jgi:hypothetical protein